MPRVPPLAEIKTLLQTAPRIKAEIPRAEDLNLGALVAQRMGTQLGESARILKVDPEQFTRAYAGDQRSVKGALRSLQEQENLAQGLPASPGRRRILKQGASAVAQAAVPAPIKAVLPKLNPIEAATQLSQEVLTHPVDRGALFNQIVDTIMRGNMGDELHDIDSVNAFENIFKYYGTKLYPEEKIPHLKSAFDKLENVQSQPLYFINDPRVTFGEIAKPLENLPPQWAYNTFPESARENPSHNLSANYIRDIRKVLLEHPTQIEGAYGAEASDPAFLKHLATVPEGEGTYWGTPRRKVWFDPGDDLYTGVLHDNLKLDPEWMNGFPDSVGHQAEWNVLKPALDAQNFTAEELNAIEHLQNNIPMTGEVWDERALPNLAGKKFKKESDFHKYIEKYYAE